MRRLLYKMALLPLLILFANDTRAQSNVDIHVGPWNYNIRILEIDTYVSFKENHDLILTLFEGKLDWIQEEEVVNIISYKMITEETAEDWLESEGYQLIHFHRE